MCAQFLVCFVSQFLVVMIDTLHRMAQVSLLRTISWSSHDERISSTLSPPFSSSSSSHHLLLPALPLALLPLPSGQWQHCVLRLNGDGLP